MPDRDVNLPSDALWHFAPVHVPARLLHGPDDLAQRRCPSGHVRERNRASLGDECVSSSANKKLDERGLRLVVWNQNWSEAVEGTCEEGSEELEAVW
jgi:hypothetical protein